MRQSAVAFKSNGLTLEGVMASPEGLSGALPGVVLCHPHPIFGGNMNNGLVLAVSRALVEEGFMAFRFNFRSVGESEGSFSKGDTEWEDICAALALLRRWPNIKRSRLGLAGYSFGASVILNSLSKFKAAKAFALISPPLNSLEHSGIGMDKRSKLFICGDKDRLVAHDSLEERVNSFRRPAGLRVVQGADHSWHGYELEAANQATQFFVSTIRN